MKVDCQENIPDLLMGDADKLHQILVNLVGNAIKFTNQGSVTLVIQLADKPTAEDQPIELRFQVKDTGIGIPEEEIANVFKSFRQLGTTRDSNHRGTGLGLVIAAELVEMMGGKICVESNPGVGTTFYFSAFFPLASPDQESLLLFGERPSSTDDRTAGGAALHILLVEDEYINRTLAINVLEREGWSVSIAENGVEALAVLETESFDLILMDVQMPEMDGYETTRTIRRQEQETTRHMPIIAMTAYAVKGDREKCLAAGMDGYISKPIRPDRLRNEIETILQHHLTR
jgi:CheY-like chemotaxis protein